MLGLNVNDELLLGGHGANPQANQMRLEQARSIIDQEAEFSNKAYREAVWPDEPEVIAPTMAYILVGHGGDTKEAVQDPQMVAHLVNKLGYKAGMTAVYDARDNGNLLWSSTTPRDEDPAGREVVRDVLNRLGGEVGVDPISEVAFQEVAGLGALTEAGTPPPPPAPLRGPATRPTTG